MESSGTSEIPDCTVREQLPQQDHLASLLSEVCSEPAWLTSELGIPPSSRRNELPKPREKLPKVNIFSLVRDAIGKDLHHVCIPTHVNEPLTDLQRRVETFESCELLDQAASHPPQSMERLLLVAVFVVSQYNTIKRNEKPFKNLEGATYELVYPEKCIRAIGEKVKHVPIEHALHIEGRSWTYSGSDRLHMALRPNCAIFRPIGEMHLRFHDHDEYLWSTVNSYVNNLFIGHPFKNHGGSFWVKCLSSGNRMLGSITRKTAQVLAHYEEDGHLVEGVSLTGAWNEDLWASYPDRRRRMLWQAGPLHKTHSKFLFPKWALHLNEVTPELIAKLPPTDDRLRPDMRLMEHGYYVAANNEKLRLEAKQRQWRKAVHAAGKEFQPRWFEKVKGGRSGLDLYRYKGGYWEAREKGQWGGIRDIYGPGPDRGDGCDPPAQLLV